jgi:hypothetical protein
VRVRGVQKSSFLACVTDTPDSSFTPSRGNRIGRASYPGLNRSEQGKRFGVASAQEAGFAILAHHPGNDVPDGDDPQEAIVIDDR